MTEPGDVDAQRLPTGGAPREIALRVAGNIPFGRAQRMSITSQGRCIVVGDGQLCADVALCLADNLDVTLILLAGSDVMVTRHHPTTIHARAVTVRGAFGKFIIDVQLVASATGPAATTIEADIVVDLTGGPTLLAGCGDRDGYCRASPTDTMSLVRATAWASSHVGTFEKPLYVTLDPNICAHSRNKKQGCNRCLDRCPAGAISPNGDAVVIDHAVCEGCGLCASTCPTGAIRYQEPTAQDLLQYAARLIAAYGIAGGGNPRLLVCERGHGEALIEAGEHFGTGLPENVLPVTVQSICTISHDLVLSLLLFGASSIAILPPPRHRTSRDVIDSEIDLALRILESLGLQNRVTVLHGVADPDDLENQLRSGEPAALPSDGARPAEPTMAATKRLTIRATVTELARRYPARSAIIELPAGSPYGRVVLDSAKCTLCLACTAACPTSALQDNPDKPELNFTEQRCIQCGICVRTCPETALTLEPRLSLDTSAEMAQTLKSEDPATCRKCGKAFGTLSTIRRVQSALARTRHFPDQQRLELIEMCTDCRVVELMARTREPLARLARPRPRTSDDYL